MKPRMVKTDILYNGVDANRDISDVLSDFDFTDSIEESDSISLTLGDREKMWAGTFMPVNGDRIQASIVMENWNGQGKESRIRCGEFVVDSYRIQAPPQKIMIEGVSAPVDRDFKDTKRTQTWEKVTIRQIAAEIAARYGLSLVYDTAKDITLEREEQNEKTDSAYLKELCNQYGLGIKVYASQLVIWSYEEYEAREPTAYIWPEMASKWSYKGSIQGTYTGAKVSYSSPKKKETLTAFVGQEGRVLNVNQKAESVADAERIGTYAIQNANRKEITAEITLCPEIALPAAASQVLALSGFGKIDGRYFVTCARHRLSSRGEYQLSLSMYRIAGQEETKQAEGSGGSGENSYTVKSGDTLWDLARSFYGDATKYSTIYNANRDKIEEEAKRRGKESSNGGYWIFPGTELTIPPA